MSATTAANSMADLAGRLTDPHDREAYASLVSYLNSLPPGDELRRMAELFGLLSLLGQRLPDALVESMAQMRELTDKAGEYYGSIDERLEHLPGAITEAVDVPGMAKNFGELFRQEIAAAGLEASAAYLRATSTEMGALTAKLKPVAQQYASLADSIAAAVTKLTAASAELQSAPVPPAAPAQAGSVYSVFLLILMFLIGAVSGVFVEKAGVLPSMSAPMDGLQTPVVPPILDPGVTK